MRWIATVGLLGSLAWVAVYFMLVALFSLIVWGLAQ